MLPPKEKCKCVLFVFVVGTKNLIIKILFRRILSLLIFQESMDLITTGVAFQHLAVAPHKPAYADIQRIDGTMTVSCIEPVYCASKLSRYSGMYKSDSLQSVSIGRRRRLIR